MDEQEIISSILENTFELYSEVFVMFNPEYFDKYVKRLNKLEELDCEYVQTSIGKEDEGYIIYHILTGIYYGDDCGLYVNMVPNTVDTLDDIKIVDKKGEVIRTIKSWATM